VASNKSFGLLGGSKLRDWGDPCAANVILPKHFLLQAIRSAVATSDGPGVEDREALAKRMVSSLDEGYEGFGWKVHETGREIGKEVRATLAKSLLDYFNDPLVPTSGDELTYFMTMEIMSRLAPPLLLVNFWTSTSPTSARIPSTSRPSGAPTASCTASGSTRSRCRPIATARP
jgi:hypothetical protein